MATDILIVGGGAAGCAAAVEAREKAPHLNVVVAEKAHISRSGCLAMGLNAINAYLPEGKTPEQHVESVRRDSHGVVREDLLLSLAREVNNATHRIESWGLPIPRDSKGRPFNKGPNSIRILGESLKPILARRVAASGAEVLNRHALLELKVRNNRVCGAYFFQTRTGDILDVSARAVILATGGAAGLYKTSNQGESRNRMWYSPFNTGAGYAAALRAGAELTTMEMRFIPTRIRHTAAPTGTLAQTFGAEEKNICGNAFYSNYSSKWGVERLTTPQRLRAILEETKAGRGPVALKLSGGKFNGSAAEVLGAYLDMTPTQVALWASEGFDPARDVVEIATSGPYILGGHTASGLWVDVDRRSTVAGLYAAGDVAGGAPKKYVSGAWVEGFRSAQTAVSDIESGALPAHVNSDAAEGKRVRDEATASLRATGRLRPDEARERLQRIMDDYAGGASTFYEIHGKRLSVAKKEVEALEGDLAEVTAENLHEAMLAREMTEKITTARSLIEHLTAREETRWPGYQTRVDFPEASNDFLCFVNSRMENGKIVAFKRSIEDAQPI